MSNSQHAQSLSDSLHLALPPVAITFADVVPPGLPMFDATAAAGCQFWQHAAQRAFVTTPRDMSSALSEPSRITSKARPRTKPIVPTP